IPQDSTRCAISDPKRASSVSAASFCTLFLRSVSYNSDIRTLHWRLGFYAVATPHKHRR
ncbi:hypothetical protein WG66_012915, partial [Moniliophthora roreri]